MNEGFALEVYETFQFRKDLKKIKKQNKDLNKLKNIIYQLVHKNTLKPKFKDHLLKNNYKDRRECHIEPDWLLIYKITQTQLILERSGSHSELFE